jgi:hypothetical protein
MSAWGADISQRNHWPLLTPKSGHVRAKTGVCFGPTANMRKFTTQMSCPQPSAFAIAAGSRSAVLGRQTSLIQHKEALAMT